MVTIDDIRAAAERLRGTAEYTPLLHSRHLSNLTGGDIWLKAECLQRTGSFKVRGATNMTTLLSPAERARGVIAASAGNHAQGVAVAARAAGIAVTIVMPLTASLAKVEATRGYGARVVQTGHSYLEAAEAMQSLAVATGATVIPAFDDARVIAGQGTVGLEIVEQRPDVELVLIPVGGGGLAAGVALAVKALAPAARVVGVQAAAAPAACRSFEHGAVLPVAAGSTVADGIAVGRPGEVTLPLLRRHVDEMVTVDEESITGAMASLLERAKLVVEGAGAVGVAALLSGAVRPEGRRTVVVLSGGNVDLNLLGRVVEHGLSHAGRYVALRIALADRPGELARLLAVIAEQGANVLDVEHRRSGARLRFGEALVDLLLETRDAAHADELRAALTSRSYVISAVGRGDHA